MCFVYLPFLINTAGDATILCAVFTRLYLMVRNQGRNKERNDMKRFNLTAMSIALALGLATVAAAPSARNFRYVWLKEFKVFKNRFSNGNHRRL